MTRSDVLVDADWVEAHLGDPGVVIVEVDEDTSAYDKGHIANAVKIDWKKDLQDPVRRDFVDRESRWRNQVANEVRPGRVADVEDRDGRRIVGGGES